MDKNNLLPIVYWTQALNKDDDDLIYADEKRLPVDSQEAQDACGRINKITSTTRPKYPPRNKAKRNANVVIYLSGSDIVIKITAEQRDTGSRYVPIDVHISNAPIGERSQIEIDRWNVQIKERITEAIRSQINRTIMKETQDELEAALAYVSKYRSGSLLAAFRIFGSIIIVIMFPYLLYRYFGSQSPGNCQDLPWHGLPMLLSLNNLVLLIMTRVDPAQSLFRSFFSTFTEK